MLIDFHTHTTASDGALTPIQLVERAREAGVRQLAITDHDTVAGYREAAAHYTHNGADLRLVPGIEYSCTWGGATIHVLGLGVDCDHPAMVEGLTVLAKARTDRSQVIAQRLDKLGFPGALAGAEAQAGDGQVGRPHFAGWMVAQEYVPDANTAFDKYLGSGKPGDVKAYWPELETVCKWIVQSGGVAVLAHPLKYKFTRMKLRRLVQAFREAGGSALEVHSGRQTPDQVVQLRSLALDFGLDVSAGSDFHRDSDWAPRLGVDLPDRPGLTPVWRRWSDNQA